MRDEAEAVGQVVATGRPAMQLRLAGAAPVLHDGTRSWPLAPRDALLLAWLALEGPTPRERLAALIWPDSDTAAARNTLRQRLFQLRRQAGSVLVEGQAVLALADAVVHDLADGDGVLGDRDAGATGELAQWLDRQRAQCRQRMRLALERLASLAEQAQDWGGALAHAEELVTLEPLSEPAHRRVMRLHYLRGDRAGALAAFDRCERWLKDELGARPGPETLQLLATVEAAGADAPAPAPAAARLPASVLRPPRLVGRQAALRALDHARQAQRVPWVQAEAGLGKTRLLQALAERWPGLVPAAARPGDAAVPLSALARVMATLHAAHPQAAERLGRTQRVELARLVPALAPDASPAAAAPAPEDEAALGRALAAWWQALDGGFAGLALDDLQWADEASLEVLGDWIVAAPADGERAWVLASRPVAPGSPVMRLWDRLAAASLPDPVPLAPLDEPALATLVDSLDLAGTPDGLAQVLHRHCGGNPLFVLETIRQAWANGLVGQPAPAWVGSRPPGVAAVIRDRLAGLPAGALALARVAAVAGPDFDVALAEAVLGRPAVTLADDWAVLESAQILRDEAFAHDLVFETVRDGVPAAIGRHLHGRIAQHLASREGAAPRAARIAGHWERAGQPLRALPWLAQAAELAWRRSRPREQLDFLRRQADILVDHDRVAEAFDVLLSATRHHLGVDLSSDAGTAWCDRLDRLASDERQRLQARLLRLHLLAQRGDDPKALLPEADACVATAAALGDAALAAEAASEQGRVLVMADLCGPAVAPLTAAATWARDHAGPAAYSEAAGTLAVALDNTGQLDAALPWHRAAVDAAHAAGDLSQAKTVLSNLACNGIDRGDLQQAVTHLREALALAARMDGQAAQQGQTRCLLGGCEIALGHYAQGLALLDEAERVLAAEQPHFLPVIASHRAMAWWQMGQDTRALQALAAVPDDEGTLLVARVRRAVLRARLARQAPGSPATAAAELDAALALTPADIRPDLHWPLRVERARGLPPPQALDELAAARDATRALGLGGAWLAALVRSIEAATPAEPQQAAAWAREALSAGQRLTPATLYPAELWCAAARAFEAAGAPAEARRCWAAARDWVQARADEDVPPAWRATFMAHQPVNVSIRAAAARA
ncbi:BTAD domain-containing putative transcriptional regulator [Ideonella sp.]|uniref:BTAD domain-containing putative transcriptional regulator n=1 Tax=Ideonella sp. TaxID=1929293 RepID=UPI0035B4E890